MHIFLIRSIKVQSTHSHSRPGKVVCHSYRSEGNLPVPAVCHIPSSVSLATPEEPMCPLNPATPPCHAHQASPTLPATSDTLTPAIYNRHLQPCQPHQIPSPLPSITTPPCHPQQTPSALSSTKTVSPLPFKLVTHTPVILTVATQTRRSIS